MLPTVVIKCVQLVTAPIVRVPPGVVCGDAHDVRTVDC